MSSVIFSSVMIVLSENIYRQDDQLCIHVVIDINITYIDLRWCMYSSLQQRQFVKKVFACQSRVLIRVGSYDPFDRLALGRGQSEPGLGCRVIHDLCSRRLTRCPLVFAEADLCVVLLRLQAHQMVLCVFRVHCREIVTPGYALYRISLLYNEHFHIHYCRGN